MTLLHQLPMIRLHADAPFSDGQPMSIGVPASGNPPHTQEPYPVPEALQTCAPERPSEHVQAVEDPAVQTGVGVGLGAGSDPQAATNMRDTNKTAIRRITPS